MNTQLHTAAVRLVETIKELREHEPTLRHLNLDEIENAIELSKPNRVPDFYVDASQLPRLQRIETVLAPAPRMGA